METSPYKVNQVENLHILTLVVDSINARNAHWIKDEILSYIQRERPSGLLVNLNNVLHLGHIGLGALIAINNQIRNLEPHAFVGLKTEVSERIHASHLDNVFRLWSPAEACIICQKMNCVHHQGFIDKINEFPAVKFDDSKIPHLNEKIAPPVQKNLELDDAHPVKPYGGTKVGMIGMAAVLAIFLVGGTWLAARKYFTEGGFPQGRAATADEILEKYDKNRDGELTKADVDMMDSGERFIMSFKPYCTQLHIACATGGQ